MDLYEQHYNPKRPVICFDERPCQLIGDALIPVALRPGNPKRNTFAMAFAAYFSAFEPRVGKRVICVNKRRTKVNYANFMKMLADHYPDAETILSIQDNLNTHTVGLFYEAIPPDDAFKLSRRFEYHYTLKKDSWLNMAEIELQHFQSNAWIAGLQI